jgi:hypothetical protein
MTLVVNIFGGPGCGKSTAAAGTYFKLKSSHVHAELVTEFAKDKVWEDSLSVLANQIYIFANQHQRIFRCLNKVDVIVTDSPVNLGLIYGTMYGNHLSEPLEQLIRYEFQRNHNLNIVLERASDYDSRGRVQTYEEALMVDKRIIEILQQDDLPYVVLPVTPNVPDLITSLILDVLSSHR